jgi:hypothetical protein
MQWERCTTARTSSKGSGRVSFLRMLDRAFRNAFNLAQAGFSDILKAVKILGPGMALKGLRDRNKGIRIAQRQQTTSSNRAGISALMNGPYW